MAVVTKKALKTINISKAKCTANGKNVLNYVHICIYVYLCILLYIHMDISMRVGL